MLLVETTQNKAFNHYKIQKLDIGWGGREEKLRSCDQRNVWKPGAYGVREVQRRELLGTMRTATWKSLQNLAKAVEVMGMYSSAKPAKERMGSKNMETVSVVVVKGLCKQTEQSM